MTNPDRTLAAVRNIERALNDEQIIVPRDGFGPKRASRISKAQRPNVTSQAEDDPYGEIGTSGLRQYGGFVLEEWLAQLQGRRGAWAFREMMDNSPVVGAILYAIEWLARQVDWTVEEGKDSATAQFIEECMHDLNQPWDDFVNEALSMLGYGYSYHEIVYKHRNGYQPERRSSSDNQDAATSEDDSSAASSDFKDGRIGWRKLPGRAQETLLNWNFDGYSGIAGFHQIDWHGGNHHIPIEKALLFRTRTRRNNPEGYSILRTGYTSYFLLKNIQQIEAIGIERDLAGIPTITPPEGVDLFSPANAGLLGLVKEMVASVRRDEYEGLVMPTAGWQFELVSSGGSRQIDTDAVIRRYEQRIAASMLADFVLLGQDAVGSYALADVKSDLFGIALSGILDLVAETMNRYAIPRLLRINGMDVAEPPRITHSTPGRVDLDRIGTFLYQLSGAGAPIPWSKPMMERLLGNADLPTNFDEMADDPMPGQDDEQPVAPAKLPPGTEQFAREAHLGQAAPEPVPGTPAAPNTAPSVVQKSETSHGTVHDLTDSLQARQKVLADQLDQDIASALELLGEQAATAYNMLAIKASRSQLHRIVGRIMSRLNLKRWFAEHLEPVMKNHAARTMIDTQQMIQSAIDLEVGIAEKDAEQIQASAGTSIGMRDIEPQVRQAILDAVKAGFENGDHPTKIAQRIKQNVPAGRFVHAGSKYRSKLIGRTETANLQRASTLALYRSNPRIGAVRLSDGILADSDDFCRGRDGEIVPIDEAGRVQPAHPQCTLSFSPVVMPLAAVPRDLVAA